MSEDEQNEKKCKINKLVENKMLHEDRRPAPGHNTILSMVSIVQF